MKIVALLYVCYTQQVHAIPMLKRDTELSVEALVDQVYNEWIPNKNRVFLINDNSMEAWKPVWSSVRERVQLDRISNVPNFRLDTASILTYLQMQSVISAILDDVCRVFHEKKESTAHSARNSMDILNLILQRPTKRPETPPSITYGSTLSRTSTPVTTGEHAVEQISTLATIRAETHFYCEYRPKFTEFVYTFEVNKCLEGYQWEYTVDLWKPKLYRHVNVYRSNIDSPIWLELWNTIEQWVSLCASKSGALIDFRINLNLPSSYDDKKKHEIGLVVWSIADEMCMVFKALKHSHTLNDARRAFDTVLPPNLRIQNKNRGLFISQEWKVISLVDFCASKVWFPLTMPLYNMRMGYKLI